MSALLALVLTAGCPEATAFQDTERQESACALAARPSPAATADRAALERLLAEPEFARTRNRNSNLGAVLWALRLIVPAWLRRSEQR